MRVKVATLAMAACTFPAVMAQTITVDHMTQSQLIEKAQQLEAKAEGAEGAASAKLDEYPNHYTMISIRHKDGGAEIHENFADFFYVLQGKATLLTGVTVVGGKTVSPGEIRGAAIENGIQTAIGQGDVVHIPASLPHQLLVPKGGTLIYFVIKVKEK